MLLLWMNSPLRFVELALALAWVQTLVLELERELVLALALALALAHGQVHHKPAPSPMLWEVHPQGMPRLVLCSSHSRYPWEPRLEVVGCFRPPSEALGAQIPWGPHKRFWNSSHCRIGPTSFDCQSSYMARRKGTDFGPFRAPGTRCSDPPLAWPHGLASHSDSHQGLGTAAGFPWIQDIEAELQWDSGIAESHRSWEQSELTCILGMLRPLGRRAGSDTDRWVVEHKDYTHSHPGMAVKTQNSGRTMMMVDVRRHWCPCSIWDSTCSPRSWDPVPLQDTWNYRWEPCYIHPQEGHMLQAGEMTESNHWVDCGVRCYWAAKNRSWSPCLDTGSNCSRSLR